MTPAESRNARNSPNPGRAIVGIGEALRIDGAASTNAGGLACEIALAAVRLGHNGVAISRIGQDPAGDELLKHLREAKVNVDHMQTDPDWPTGRLNVRSIAGRSTRTLTPQAAFDNLQWDFDLVDVGQDADAVVFGELARRGGQTKSVIKQFLAGCGSALKFYDATNRADDAALDRANVRTALEFADGVFADATALRALVPSWKSDKPSEAARTLLAETGLAAVMTVDLGTGEVRLAGHTRDESVEAAQLYPAAQHEVAIVGLMHGLLEGWDMQQCIEQAVQVGLQAAHKPGDSIEPLLRDGK